MGTLSTVVAYHDSGNCSKRPAAVRMAGPARSMTGIHARWGRVGGPAGGSVGR